MHLRAPRPAPSSVRGRGAFAARSPCSRRRPGAAPRPDRARARADFETQCGACHGRPSRAHQRGQRLPWSIHAGQRDLTGVDLRHERLPGRRRHRGGRRPRPASGGGVTDSGVERRHDFRGVRRLATVTCPTSRLGGVLRSVSQLAGGDGACRSPAPPMTYQPSPAAPGAHCTNRTINAFGTGTAVGGITPNTANRVITVTVNAPNGTGAATRRGHDRLQHRRHIHRPRRVWALERHGPRHGNPGEPGNAESQQGHPDCDRADDPHLCVERDRVRADAHRDLLTSPGPAARQPRRAR